MGLEAKKKSKQYKKSILKRLFSEDQSNMPKAKKDQILTKIAKLTSLLPSDSEAVEPLDIL